MHPLKKFTVKYKLGSTIKVSMIVKHFDFDDAMFSKNQLTTTSKCFRYCTKKGLQWLSQVHECMCLKGHH